MQVLSDRFLITPSKPLVVGGSPNQRGAVAAASEIANVDKIAWIWRRNQPAPQVFKGH